MGFCLEKLNYGGLNRREQLWICALVFNGIRQAERDLHNQSLDSCRVLREQDIGLGARHQSPTGPYREQFICGIQGPKRKAPSGMGGLCC